MSDPSMAMPNSTTPPSGQPADFNATQTTTPDFWQNLETDIDPTTHPYFYIVGALALSALLFWGSGKPKKKSSVTRSKRSITIQD